MFIVYIRVMLVTTEPLTSGKKNQISSVSPYKIQYFQLYTSMIFIYRVVQMLDPATKCVWIMRESKFLFLGGTWTLQWELLKISRYDLKVDNIHLFKRILCISRQLYIYRQMIGNSFVLIGLPEVAQPPTVFNMLDTQCPTCMLKFNFNVEKPFFVNSFLYF